MRRGYVRDKGMSGVSGLNQGAVTVMGIAIQRQATDMACERAGRGSELPGDGAGTGDLVRTGNPARIQKIGKQMGQSLHRRKGRMTRDGLRVDVPADAVSGFGEPAGIPACAVESTAIVRLHAQPPEVSCPASSLTPS
jgi:hypothetical protein